MQTEIGQVIPYAENTRIKLTADVEGRKFIGGEWVDHTLSTGSIVFIRASAPFDTRTSINTDPLTSDAYRYKLEATMTENFLDYVPVGPIHTASNESQKICHTALDSQRCPPQGNNGMYVGSPTVKIPKHAYYLKVQRANRSMVPKQITWRSKHYIESRDFEVVQE
ncbi:hypothetical protein AGABI2DRAFT_181621 [Agaricus bisporus var. bisporus H97]|uniref:hypothetical protein n=1 Tax=Agaricus bisporus var. bisporus (strain H97 / ATCC MYA-4626 / FGSC 10389) TaxID=936046 RepID=UPI00029F5F80|nr:hypothetical protein AGABI2DRAFT_181621 [Agaricus bisporus var. bisporus H97]EKV41789.1 hypothetical protein AGABI2DRAFT_181621 [Agaricus bisporus var. bisporus H97]